MFSLYIDKEKMELVVGKINNLTDIVTNEIVKFNSCYYIGPDRKELKKYAENMKLEWLKEAEDRVENLKNLKIKNKY